MSNKNIVNALNEQFIDLLKQLIKVYPTLEQLKEFHTALKLMLMTDNKFLIRVFKTHVYQYKEKIEKEDESFFLDIDYSKYQDDDLTKQSEIFKKIWKSNLTTDDTKKNIWLYFKLFMKLVEKYK